MRNGKLVALAWKQLLQEKLDIDSEENDLHALNIICDTDKDNDDFCVDFKLIGEKFSFSRRKNVNNKTIRIIYCYENFCSHTIFLLVGFICHCYMK
jgi:hypothetical protein